nr:MAG TPA: lipoprotein [Caudoviricetes sp.]
MKKILLLMMTTLAITGCSNEEQDNLVPEEVTVNIDYDFWESGSMSRSGVDLYTNFYNKYVKTKLLTPTTYSLSLSTKDMPKPTTINGYWGNKDGIRLVEGTYNIYGTSIPTSSEASIDTLSMSFNEKVTITKETTSITLTAKHSSFMLIFDASNAISIEYSGYLHGGFGTYSLNKKDEIYYIFLSKDIEASDQIVVTRKNKKKVIINLDGLSFEKGKYYYFNDVTNSFDIPPMTEGN